MPFYGQNEQGYIDLVKHVMTMPDRVDRTGTGTRSDFGATVVYDISGDQLPLFTTKRVAFQAVIKELLWIIRGSTNAEELREDGVHIWDVNGNRKFLDSIGLSHHKEWDLGPIYGFQWRHFGAKYKTCDDDYEGQGIDQLKELIEGIKSNRFGRRHIMNAWNVTDLNDMALPPCHVMCQFYVESDNTLSCMMYQRSCDLGLGVPFNVASYSLLTKIIARECGLSGTKNFIHNMGDCHVYLNHIEALSGQVARDVRPPPKIEITAGVSIFALKPSDCILKDYNPHPPVKMIVS